MLTKKKKCARIAEKYFTLVSIHISARIAAVGDSENLQKEGD